jgi:endoglucanase
MRWRAAWLAACVCMLLAGGAHAELSPQAQAAQMRRGVNILGYDPIWKDPAKARFQMRLFKVIRDGGFDAVRINLQAFAHMDRDNRLDPVWMATLDRMVAAALAQDLSVILDEHDYLPCGSDAAACKPRLMAFWQQIAPHFAASPDRVLFEILNEPNHGMDAGWNGVMADALAVIRQSNPGRNVIVGPVAFNNIDRLGELRLPADSHLIVTFHYYAPYPFTHQGARGTSEEGKSGVHWGVEHGGSAQDRAGLVRDFDRVAAWQRQTGNAILLGEFGAFDVGDMPSRTAYFEAVTRAAEAHGWPWFYWQFDDNFIVYDIPGDRWVEPIHRALVPDAP